MLLPVVFGRAKAGLTRGFAAGFALGFATGLIEILGFATGLIAGACFGVGKTTAGADLTGFGRTGVSTLESRADCGWLDCGWAGTRGGANCGGSTGNGAGIGATGSDAGTGAGVAGVGSSGVASGTVGSVGNPTTGSAGNAGSGSLWIAAGGVNNAPSGASSCVCASARESSRAMASSETRATNEVFRLFHLRGVGWPGCSHCMSHCVSSVLCCPATFHEGSGHLVLMLSSIGLDAFKVRAVRVASRACRLHSHLLAHSA